MKSQRIFWGLSVSAFAFWALSLAVPTGYSYGAVGMLLASLLGCGGVVRHGIDRVTWILIAMLLAMGLLWGMAFDGWLSWSDTDYWPKYWLAAFCLLVVAYRGIQPEVIPWGLAAGSLGALGVALYQYQDIKISGFTNAIQYGGIAMYLGLATWVFAILGGYRFKHAAVLLCLGSLGIVASVLSGTRGAWLIAPLLMLVVWWSWLLHGHRRMAVYAVAVPLLLGAMAVLPFWDRVDGRIQEAVNEASLYQAQPEQAAITSIGQRLEQWQLAWHLGWDKPWTGWGVEGFIQGKKAYVEQGRAHPSVHDYGHAHNEILDMFAKRGLVGVVVLLLFYAVPLVLFCPTRQRIQALPIAVQKRALALRTSASLLPMAYFGFGWTQVFFAHNSGHMFYVFSWVAFWGGIRHLEGKTLPFQGNQKP